MVPRQNIEERDAHWIEWATGFISALLVFSMIGFISLEAFTERDVRPDLRIVLTSRSPVVNGYRVTFDITNGSTVTAAGVVVRGEILDRSEPVESADVTFDYVPAESKSSGAFFFSQDPGSRDVRLRALGYVEP